MGQHFINFVLWVDIHGIYYIVKKNYSNLTICFIIIIEHIVSN